LHKIALAIGALDAKINQLEEQICKEEPESAETVDPDEGEESSE